MGTWNWPPGSIPPHHATHPFCDVRVLRQDQALLRGERKKAKRLTPHVLSGGRPQVSASAQLQPLAPIPTWRESWSALPSALTSSTGGNVLCLAGPVTATDAHWRGAAAAPPVAAQARGWGWGWVGEGGRGLRKQVGWLRRLAQPDPKLDQMLSAGIVAPLSQ